MIRNLIFDLGNVLLSWKPEEYFIRNGYNAEETLVIYNNIFRSSEWRLLDNGDISIDEAIDRIAERTMMKKHEIRAVFDLRLKILFPLDPAVKMLPGLKKQGFKLYFLSNFPDDIFDELCSRYEFFKYFDGGLISARAKASKPDRKIYEILMDKYSLKPEECLFADDTPVNVTGAENVGMKALHVEDPDDMRGQLLKIADIAVL